MNRREFIGKTALATLATGAFPFIRSARADEPGANEKIRLGLIGCGGQGQADLKYFFKNPEIDCAVICDVYDDQIARGLEICEDERGKKTDAVKDFRRVLDRKDVDIVLIATPDHWHALPMVQAAQAGKDIYIEKPLAKTIDEGRAMLDASKKFNRIVQMGSQWSSALHVIQAAEMIRAGKLGKIHLARAWAFLDWLPGIGHVPDSAPPPGLDYNFWLGPAPLHAFNQNRFLYNFRWFWDYAGGLMTDWSVHLLNIIAMAMPPEPLKSVCASGGKFIFDDDSETPDSLVAVYEFPNYQMIWEHRAGLNNGLNGRPWGVEWHGTEGNLILDATGWTLTQEPRHSKLPAQVGRASGDPLAAHIKNFLDCVKSRRQPALDLEKGHRVSTQAHLGNIAYRTGRKIIWDGEREKIVGDRHADKFVGVKYRKPWHLPDLRK